MSQEHYAAIEGFLLGLAANAFVDLDVGLLLLLMAILLGQAFVVG